MAMRKRLPFAGYGDEGVASPREPGAGLAKRARSMAPMTSAGGPGGGGPAAPRVPPPSPLPPDVDLTSLIEGRPGQSALTPGNVDAFTTPGGMGETEGVSSPISTVLQMILRRQGGRA